MGVYWVYPDGRKRGFGGGWPMLLKTPIFTSKLVVDRLNIAVFVSSFVSGGSCIPDAKLPVLVCESVMRETNQGRVVYLRKRSSLWWVPDDMSHYKPGPVLL